MKPKNKASKKYNGIKLLFFGVSFMLLVLALIFLGKAYIHYEEFKSHREYFKQPNPKIQPWMTIPTIVRYFNISESEIQQKLNITAATTERGMSMGDICIKKNINCTEIIKTLNNQSSK